MTICAALLPDPIPGGAVPTRMHASERRLLRPFPLRKWGTRHAGRSLLRRRIESRQHL